MDYNVNAMLTKTAEVEESYATGRMIILGLMAFAALVASLAGLFLVASIATPVQADDQAMRRLAAHDMTSNPGPGPLG